MKIASVYMMMVFAAILLRVADKYKEPTHARILKILNAFWRFLPIVPC